MVQALAPNRTNDALNIRPLPGGSRGGKDFLDPHVGYLSAEVSAENGVAIAEQVARELVKGKGFAQLLSRPFRRLCLSKTPKCLSRRELYFFHNSLLRC